MKTNRGFKFGEIIKTLAGGKFWSNVSDGLLSCLSPRRVFIPGRLVLMFRHVPLTSWTSWTSLTLGLCWGLLCCCTVVSFRFELVASCFILEVLSSCVFLPPVLIVRPALISLTCSALSRVFKLVFWIFACRWILFACSD